MNKRELTEKIVFTAISLALIFLFTLISIPFVGGYINLGDAAIFFVSITLPMPYALLASGVGSMLADITLGYLIYAPFTFVIKALCSVFICLIVKGRDKLQFWIIAALVSAIIVQIGYFFTNTIILGTFGAALGTVPVNLIQSGVCVPLGVLLSVLLTKIRFIRLKRESFGIKNSNSENSQDNSQKDKNS